MLLHASCVFLLVALAHSAPHHMTEDQYIDELLRQELEGHSHREGRQSEETFGQQFNDRDNYDQAEEGQQKNANIEQFDEDQQRNGIEHFDDQSQSGNMEQFDEDQQNNGIEQFDEPQSGESNDKQADNTEQALDDTEQSSGDSPVPDKTVPQAEDRINKDLVDKLYGDKNAEDNFPEDEEFSDVFGKAPASPEVGNRPESSGVEDYQPVTPRPNWFRRTWNKTKETVKGLYHKVKGSVG